MTIHQYDQQDEQTPSADSPRRDSKWIAAGFGFFALELLYLLLLDGNMRMASLMALGAVASPFFRYWWPNIKYRWQAGYYYDGEDLEDDEYEEEEFDEDDGDRPPVPGFTFIAPALAILTLILWVLISGQTFNVNVVQAQTQANPPAAASTAPDTSQATPSIAPEHAALPLDQRITDWWQLPYTIRDFDQSRHPYTTVAKPAVGDTGANIIYAFNQDLNRACRYDLSYADGVLADGTADPLYPPNAPSDANEYTCPKFNPSGDLLAGIPGHTGSHRQYEGVIADTQAPGILHVDWTPSPSGDVWTFRFTTS
jgi:hypothetical protein